MSSLSSSWLNKRGISIPEQKVNIGLSYLSKSFQLPESPKRDWAIKLVYPNPPQEKIGGTISKVEGNRYIVTLIGYHNEVNAKEVLKNDSSFIELSSENQDIYNSFVKVMNLVRPISILMHPRIIKPVLKKTYTTLLKGPDSK